MKILVVDDEKNIRESLRIILEQDGYEVSAAENGLSAQRLIESDSFDAGIFDLKMPGLSGLELLEWLQKREERFPVIMISAFGQVEDAVKALKTGADDYVIKPFDPEVLLEKIGLLKSCSTSAKVIETLSESETPGYFFGNSPVMEKLSRRLDRVAASSSIVLLTGESGVGKEMTARLIHKRSAVSEGPFMALNIGGLPENLVESELFGYEKGAFTGAEKQKKGLFELASGGTLFLDEIGEMALPLQVKLLRVLQERQFRRLGGLENLSIDARIITATNRNLEQMVEAGSFREDLYYRLNVARIEIPPLRDRKEDLPGLAGHLIDKLNRKMGLNVRTLSKDAWEKLSAHSFPGNIRELENILERSMIFVEDEIIRGEDLELPLSPSSPQSAVPAVEGGRTLKELEKSSIIAALHRWEGNRSRAAKELGISRRTIINKIQEYGLDGPDGGD